MARTSPVHYIAPSAISITPNCNSSANDIAVYLARGAEIDVYSPRAGIDYVDAQAQTWTLRGRNRRLADSTKPYTIYARLSKTDYTNGYLVFASKNEQGGVWYDKYNYITPLGLSDVTGATTSSDYWYVRLGDVGLPSQNERTLSYDTGVLGTTLYNSDWAISPDAMPLRISVACSIAGADAGVNPYVYWNQTLNLTATLTEGWTGTDIQRFTRWQITRDTADAAADTTWADSQKAQQFATTGTIALSHQRGSSDDFNGAVSTFFTITAWGRATDGSNAEVVLEQTTVNILAETVESYDLVCSSEYMSYSPQTQTYSPSGGIDVSIRTTDQRGDVSDLNVSQIIAAQLTASYAEVGGSSWTVLSFTNVSGVATANIPTTAFANGKSLTLRLVNAQGQELTSRTLALVSNGQNGQNGEDAQDAEWVYIRTKTATSAPVISNDTAYTDHNGRTYTSDGHLPRVVAQAGNTDIESNNSGDASYPFECTANPKGTNDTWRYEWELKRTKGAADATTHKRSWNAYSGSMVLRTDPAFNQYINTILGGATGDAHTVAIAQNAVLDALRSTVYSDGGLLLTSILGVRKLKNGGDPDVLSDYDTWGGISGEYDDWSQGTHAKGHGIAAWYGGDMIDYEMLSQQEQADGWNGDTYHIRWAKSLDRFDGSGYRANGNISWDEDGNVTIKGTVIRDATYYVDGQDVTDILKLFRKVRVGGTDADPLYMIEAAYGLYALGDLQALGYSPSQGGGGGASVLYELNDVSPNAANNAVLGIVIDDQNPQGDGYVLTFDYNSKHWYAAPAAETYRLPQATSQALGGIKIGYTPGAGETRNYAVVLNDDGKAYVNVPWVSGSFGTEGTDNVQITLGGTTKTVLTDHQSLSGYATQKWVNDKGYITSSGSCSYANSAGSVAWSDVDGHPTDVSSFNNDSGYITSSGSCSYADSAGYASSAGSAGSAGSADYATSAGSADSAGWAGCIGDGTMDAVAQYNNEINFGGTYNSGTIYFGYRARGNKGVPSSFVFGEGWGSASITCNYLYANSDVQVTSDERRKDVIGDVQLSVEQIAKMPSVLFRWKKGFGDDLIHVGTIAQSWEKVLPAAVGIGTDELKTRSFSYSSAAYAIGVADAKEIVALKKRVSELEAELKQLKSAS